VVQQRRDFFVSVMGPLPTCWTLAVTVSDPVSPSIVKRAE
jgi:hypothetical protein